MFINEVSPHRLTAQTHKILYSCFHGRESHIYAESATLDFYLFSRYYLQYVWQGLSPHSSCSHIGLGKQRRFLNICSKKKNNPSPSSYIVRAKQCDVDQFTWTRPETTKLHWVLETKYKDLFTFMDHSLFYNDFNLICNGKLGLSASHPLQINL